MNPEEQREVIKRIKQGPLSVNANTHRNSGVNGNQNSELKLKHVSFLDDDGSRSRFSSIQPITEDYQSTSVENAKGPSMISSRWQIYQKVQNRKTPSHIPTKKIKSNKPATKEFQTQTSISGNEIATQTKSMLDFKEIAVQTQKNNENQVLQSKLRDE